MMKSRKASSRHISITLDENSTTSVTVTNPEVIKPTKTIHTDTKAVDLAPTITNLQNDLLQDNRCMYDEVDDGDSRDNEDLVIDLRDELVDTNSKINDISGSERCKCTKCTRHCSSFINRSFVKFICKVNLHCSVEK